MAETRNKTEKVSQADIDLATTAASTKESLKLQKRALSGQSIATASTELVASMYGQGRQALDVIGGAVRNEAEKINASIQGIRELYGGMTREIDFNYMAESASSNALKRYMVMSDAYAEVSNKAIMGSVKTGKEVLDNISDRGNIIETLLGDPAVAQKNAEAILNDLSTMFGDEVGKLEEEQIVKMAFYEQTLGTTSQTLQEIFQKQIGFTGEMSTDVLDKLGAYAANLSNELNIPMKTLTRMTTEMMSNTQMFGDITVQEATRMSAKLSQLGVTMGQLNQQSSKFGSFEGAAAAAGTIAQLTGAQVDAMKMSFLASEGKFDELIEYQRDSLHKAGFTKEKFLNQSNSMRNAIADAYGRSQEEMAILLDKNRRISSQEDLDSIMKEGEVAEEDGFDRLLDNIDNTKMALKTVDELIEASSEKAKMASTESAVKAMQQQADLNAAQVNALETIAKDVNIERIEKSLNAVGELYKTIDPRSWSGTAKDMLETLTGEASKEGGFFYEMNEAHAKQLQMKENMRNESTVPADVASVQSTSAKMTQAISGDSVQRTDSVPVSHNKFEINIEQDGKGHVKHMVNDAAGKLIAESEEKIQAKLNKKVDKSE